MFIRTQSHPWFTHPWPESSAMSHFAPFGVLQNELNRLFSATEEQCCAKPAATSSTPDEVQLRDDDARLILTALLPGLREGDVELKATADYLHVHGERKISTPKGYTARHRERSPYAIDRSFRLPVKIDPEQVEAKLVNGVLTVTLPKAAEAKPRRIGVKSV